MENKRLRLGVLFHFDSSWMGGIIYIINVVKTLNFLDDHEKPEISLFYKPELSRFLGEFDYPYLKMVEWEFPPLIKGNIKSWLLRRNLFIEEIVKEYPLDVVYPLQDYPVRIKTNVKLISWSADFQHKHYPEFFSRKQILGRDTRVKNALKRTDTLVLSSHDAHKDLERFFKVRKGLNIQIYHFVSIIDNLEHVNLSDLKKKYDLPDKFYLVSNQFHKHKNHKVLLLAQAKLKEMGIRIHLAITGKMPDAEDSAYMSEIHSIINENELKDQISLLGIIPRNDQLQLMRHSQAVLQPSLFEGWSTVIEDARSLQAPVVAANLGVNMEQLGEEGVYFDPHKPDELVAILKDYPERNLDDKLYEEYEVRVKEAARTLMRIFRSA